jgi:hypothetical protein
MRRLARSSPATSPPSTAETFDLSLLAGRDFVWFKLHGRRNERYWYGDHMTTALSADRLAQADLSGAVVLVSNCWAANLDGTPGPMLVALAQTNPRAIIAGPGPNYAGLHRVTGTDLLGLYMRFLLEVRFKPHVAFAVARYALKRRRPDKATKDTLAFRLWRPQALPTEYHHA